MDLARTLNELLYTYYLLLTTSRLRSDLEKNSVYLYFWRQNHLLLLLLNLDLSDCPLLRGETILVTVEFALGEEVNSLLAPKVGMADQNLITIIKTTTTPIIGVKNFIN
ncbi:MAG: hypothetical protein QNJ72_25675 [Pleurocapsa sp. MO_226.B13]|nr:hypothetical protein [Pleurocapsa sp. MO_226.B13]